MNKIIFFPQMQINLQILIKNNNKKINKNKNKL